MTTITAEQANIAKRHARKPARSHRPYRGYRTALWIYAGVFYTFLYGPLLMIVLLSFNNSEIVGFPFQGFTTRWYDVVFASPALLKALGNSVGVGILAAAIATTLALSLAMAFRHQFRGKSIVLYLILVPIIIPGIIGGIVLLIFFGFSGVRSSLWTTVLVAHVNWVLPFAFLTLFPRLHGFDRALEEAAMDLGARPWEIFTRIVFPIIRPGVIATALFSFSLSFDEFIRTIFVSGFDRTIPVQFWGLIVDELAPQLPAMAVLIIVISIFSSLVGFYFMRRASRSAAT
ncbi:MAG: ABC transporter permease [Alphaproteobacteria bacterium]|nr:ABC transporter permease [Alphaproteobacteria bacterium]